MSIKELVDLAAEVTFESGRFDRLLGMIQRQLGVTEGDLAGQYFSGYKGTDAMSQAERAEAIWTYIKLESDNLASDTQPIEYDVTWEMQILATSKEEAVKQAFFNMANPLANLACHLNVRPMGHLADDEHEDYSHLVRQNIVALFQSEDDHSIWVGGTSRRDDTKMHTREAWNSVKNELMPQCIKDWGTVGSDITMIAMICDGECYLANFDE